VLDKLNDGDPYVIQPHYIDKKQAEFLLKGMNGSYDDHLKHELTTFRNLLEKVVNDEIILEIKNNNY